MIFTNENCVDCNKCIRSCPVLIANISKENSISVNDEACIKCGACFKECQHSAREYEDDTEKFLKDLKAGKKISVLVAPAFVANYPNDYKKIYGYLKSLGVVEFILFPMVLIFVHGHTLSISRKRVKRALYLSHVLQ